MRLEKSLIYRNFYKDLTERYAEEKSDTEGDECCDNRIHDSRVTDADAIYVTDISDVRWIAYDIPGNIGWMTCIAMLAKMIRDREFGNTAA